MNIQQLSQLDLRRWLPGAVLVVFGLTACSGSSSGLKLKDGGADGKADVGARLDGATAIDVTFGRGGAGGSVGRLDAAGGSAGRLDAAGEAGIPPLGSGGAITMDAGGGADAAGSSGSGGTGRGGTSGNAGVGGSTTGSGGAGGRRTGGAPGTGGAAGGTGGTVLRDAAPAIDSGVDAPVPADVAIDGAVGRRDAFPGRPDSATSIDGAALCGYLDEPCCAQRTCNLPTLVCASGGGGGDGTCVLCGGEGEACCEGDVCTEPNTVCTGGGRGGGTCRAQ